MSSQTSTIPAADGDGDRGGGGGGELESFRLSRLSRSFETLLSASLCSNLCNFTSLRSCTVDCIDLSSWTCNQYSYIVSLETFG